ncbi:unnamed protein product [Ceratitis capitata]|uniref:(Mediterranean fruit fly) hypothetical protein n=1 Tax=Ceratitis capitata TaxID=7213 RepID=A0A811UBG1_CERCA|nr:unnamed protein product [Ceratitis capitata]
MTETTGAKTVPYKVVVIFIAKITNNATTACNNCRLQLLLSPTAGGKWEFGYFITTTWRQLRLRRVQFVVNRVLKLYGNQKSDGIAPSPMAPVASLLVFTAGNAAVYILAHCI